MERRYICGSCGMRWFDPRPELRRAVPTCGGCGGALLPLVAPANSAWSTVESHGEHVGRAQPRR